ncbi:anti-anti-sigma factor [Haloechinothrix alba]|uniref:Anti-sigma factor antagonist n=1 Tax=Haloechinothrix alba TaxID=664784 RepID=A0A238ZDU9_9PSEU|nr:anti-anti-sigma factor [Haloechinothrix alba]
MAAPTIASAATSRTLFDAPESTAGVSGVRQAERAHRARLLWLWTSHPDGESSVVHVMGEVDAATAPDLDELLAPRLVSKVHSLVIDLSRVRFLGAAGVHVLVQAALRAEHQGMSLRLVTGPRCVERALRAGGIRVEHLHASADGIVTLRADDIRLA